MTRNGQTGMAAGWRRALAWPGRHVVAAVALLLASAFLCLAQWRAVTYACGNDPMLYIRAARVLLQPSLYGAAAVKEALTFVAPGYPILLAVGIRCFGALSPYWLNLVFLLATLPLMWVVFRRLMGSDRAAAFSLLGLVWIAFRGHSLNAPYLLYPFREASRLFFVYAAYACVGSGLAGGAPRRSRLLIGGAALLAACAIREPSVLILPGLLLGMAGLTVGWRRRVRAWGWVLLPFGLGTLGAMLLLALMRTDISGFSQFSVVGYLRQHVVALERGRLLLSWFPAEAGWLGVGLMGVGLVRAARRAPVLWAWFLLPGALLFAFYAYMHMHVRYFLTSLLFVSPFAGYGLDGLCTGLERLTDRYSRWLQVFFGRHGGRPSSAGSVGAIAFMEGRAPSRPMAIPRAILTWGCLVVAAAGLLQTGRRVTVWGPRVRAAEVREWRALAGGLAPSADGRVRVAVEQRCRYLEDLLLSYTDVELLDPKDIARWPDRWAPAHYFKPLNRHALYATPQWLMHLKVYAHSLIADRMNLRPAGTGDPAVYTIGQGRYEHMLIMPWRAGRHMQSIELDRHVANVVWLDWAASDPDIVKDVTLRDPDSGAVWWRAPLSGNGIQALWLAADAIPHRRAVFQVDSTAELPSAPVLAVTPAADPCRFSLGQDRSLSANRFFPDRDPGHGGLHGPTLRTHRAVRLRAPTLVSDPPVRWIVSLEPNLKGLDKPLRLTLHPEQGPDLEIPVSPETLPLTWEAGSGDVWTLALAAEGSPEERVGVPLDAIGFRVLTPDEKKGKVLP